MSKKLSHEENLIDFQRVHEDRYLYLEESTLCSNKFNVFCKVEGHGNFLITPSNHKRGRGCPKCVGFYRSYEEIVSKVSLLHGDKFIYHKVNTVKGFEIKIECKIHGLINQELRHHLKGHGCRKCADEANSGSSWKYSDWCKLASKSKYFDSYKVYIIRCFNEDEEFIKIGKTYRTVSLRFSRH
jgi:hypothetical protein